MELNRIKSDLCLGRLAVRHVVNHAEDLRRVLRDNRVGAGLRGDGTLGAAAAGQRVDTADHLQQRQRSV